MAASIVTPASTTAETPRCELRAGVFSDSGTTRFSKTAPAYSRSLPKRSDLGRRYTPTPTLPRKRGREFPLAAGQVWPLVQLRRGSEGDDIPHRHRCRRHVYRSRRDRPGRGYDASEGALDPRPPPPPS